ncbi:MAG: YgaP family membrane protein [Acidiferrobacterales bacterium]
MEKNVGSTEKTFRIIIGLAILPLFFVLEGNLRWLGLIGIIPIVTGIMGWCPAWFVLGIRTGETKKTNPQG